MSAAAPLAELSPYARAVGELHSLGYHVIPIMPLEKAPGEFKGGQWWRMKEWQRFRDRMPTEFERGLWARNMPAANVGIVLGSPAGQHDGAPLRLVAVDVDTIDPDEFEMIVSALPYSPMVKRGAKGETRFYRAPVTIKSKPYNHSAEKRRLVDLLTGQDTRQTVVPPSIHVDHGQPTGNVYAWLSGPVAASELPVFADDELERLEDTLRHLGWSPDAQREHPRPTPVDLDEDDYFSETKVAALANLAAWVPALDLYGLRPARGGYEAVASWRPSSTGRRLEERKRNLSIQAIGITDFGDGPKGYSAIDLVMASRSCERFEAVGWLRGRLGFGEPEPMILKPRPKVQEAFAPDTGEVLEQSKPAQLEELPDELTHIPGLLGQITDWIADTSRRPQRGLSLGAALALIGTAGGRKYGGPTRSGTHLYLLGIARTAAGKDHPIKQLNRVLAACGMQSHIGPSQFMSISAVVNRVTRQPLTLSAIDEFGAFMAKMKNKRGSTHEQAIPAFLRMLWSASFDTVSPPEWANRSADPIHSPSLSIYGVTVPDEFYAALGGGDIHNGFLNRFLLISTRKRPAERDPKVDPFEVPQDIKDGMFAIYGAGSAISRATAHNGQADGPLITAVWASPAAKNVYVDFGRAIEAREAEAAFFARTAEIALRLATIRAVGVEPAMPVITADDMAWGRDVALWSAERMIAETSDYMAENENQAQANRIVRLLRDRGEISHQELVRAMQHQLKANDLKQLLESLDAAGQIRVRAGEAPPQGGRRPQFYSLS